MAINTGIGVGEAQIFDTRGIMNNLYRQYEIKQKEDQAFANRLAEDLAKFDPSNLTGKDLQKVNDMYTQLKDFNHNIPKMKKMERALLEAKISQGMNDIKSFSTNAKQFYKDRLDFGIEIGKDKYSYLPEAADAMDKVKNFSYTEALDNNLGDINSLRLKRIPDNKLVDESLKDMKKLIDEVAVNNYPPIKVITNVKGDDVETIYHDATRSDAEKIAYAIMTDDSKKYNFVDKFKKENPNAGAPSDVDLKDFIVNSFEKLYGYRKKTKEGLVSEGGASGSIASQDQAAWIKWLEGGFSTDPQVRAFQLQKIKDITGNKVKIIPRSDGAYDVEYNPLTTLATGFTIPSTQTVKDRAANGAQLSNLLQSAGFKGTGAGRAEFMYGRLKPSSATTTPTPTPTPAPTPTPTPTKKPTKRPPRSR
jgi:hypothetical protein